MIFICLKQIDKFNFINKYDKLSYYFEFNNYNLKQKADIIKLMSDIKGIKDNFEIIFMNYSYEVCRCLEALKIDFKAIMYQEDKINNEEDKQTFKSLNSMNIDKIILDYDEDLETALNPFFEFIQLEQIEEKEEKEEVIAEENELIVEENKSIELKNLLDDDCQITQSDIIDLKNVQNKLRVGLFLQAKSSLNRVLKLANVLDKLQDKLIDRIEENLDTTDTASLFYTTEAISKLLNDTNNFIISVLNNEKIQNFFVISNTNITNVNNENSSFSTNQKEKIIKSVEIVMQNLDAFESGNFNNLINPNIVEIKKEED